MRSDGWLVLLTARAGDAWDAPIPPAPLRARRYVAEELGVDGVTIAHHDHGAMTELVLLVSFDPRLVARLTPRAHVEDLAREAAELLVHEPCLPPVEGGWEVAAAGWRPHDKWGAGAGRAAVTRS